MTVHRTEVIQNTLNPSWKPFSLSVRDLCDGDWSRTLRFEVFDWDARGKSDLIGGFTTRFVPKTPFFPPYKVFSLYLKQFHDTFLFPHKLTRKIELITFF